MSTPKFKITDHVRHILNPAFEGIIYGIILTADTPRYSVSFFDPDGFPKEATFYEFELRLTPPLEKMGFTKK